MSGHSKWANIKRKKGANDAIRGKITTKIGREITIAVRMGGADPTGNMRLKLALSKAKSNNIPKDNIKRAIEKGLGNTESGTYEELMYEGYGPGGTAVMLDILTDNRNRTAADVRLIFSKNNGTLAGNGAVSWKFKRKAKFTIEGANANTDKLMELLLEAGADVEDISGVDGESVEILAAPEAFSSVLKALEAAKIPAAESTVLMVPDTKTEVADVKAAQQVMRMVDALEEYDDVQQVFTDFDVADAIADQL